jgi:hypothetical protein
MHWWDAVDFVTEGRASFVRVMIHCVPEEASIFIQQLEHVAASTFTQLTLQNSAPPPLDGLPDLVIKTTSDRVIGLAMELAHAAHRCVALCYSGVVHVYMNERTLFFNVKPGHRTLCSCGASMERPVNFREVMLLQPTRAPRVAALSCRAVGTPSASCSFFLAA